MFYFLIYGKPDNMLLSSDSTYIYTPILIYTSLYIHTYIYISCAFFL